MKALVRQSITEMEKTECVSVIVCLTSAFARNSEKQRIGLFLFCISAKYIYIHIYIYLYIHIYIFIYTYIYIYI